LGYVERDAYEFGFEKVFEQILAYVGGAPVHVVNAATLKEEAASRAG
jgi:hypothetical protein